VAFADEIDLGLPENFHGPRLPFPVQVPRDQMLKRFSSRREIIQS